MKAVTDKQIDAILKHRLAFRNPRLLKARSDGGTEGGKGVLSLPVESQSRKVGQFISDIYEHGFLLDFDWAKWQGSAQETQYGEDTIRGRK